MSEVGGLKVPALKTYGQATVIETDQRDQTGSREQTRPSQPPGHHSGAGRPAGGKAALGNGAMG